MLSLYNIFDVNRKHANRFLLVFLSSCACVTGSNGKTSNDLCVPKNDTGTHEM